MREIVSKLKVITHKEVVHMNGEQTEDELYLETESIADIFRPNFAEYGIRPA